MAEEALSYGKFRAVAGATRNEPDYDRALSLIEAILDKIERNEEKYPVHKAKGTAKKYDEL